MGWVLCFHVLLGALWLGGAMYGESLVAASHRQGREAYIRTAITTAVNNGRIYPAVTVLLMVTAVWMILANDLSWGAGWIIGAITLWVVGVAVGIVYFAPTAKKLAERLDREGPTEEVHIAVRTMEKVARFDLILLLALLVLMIFKPGA